ncbi:MAG: nucleotide exchange factor GrpE, partial [Alphaproteobacteria bacterium]
MDRERMETGMNGQDRPAEKTAAGKDGNETQAEEAKAERSLEEIEREAEELREHLLRAKAEVVNVLKRTEREKAEIARFAIADFARDLLAVADNLHRALEAAPEKLKEDAAARSLIEGVEMT